MEQHDTRLSPSTVSADAFLTDDLNPFYAWFQASNNDISRTMVEVRSIARDE